MRIGVTASKPSSVSWNLALQTASRCDDAWTRDVAMHALSPEGDAEILLAYEIQDSGIIETILGVASYRIGDDGIKRINTAAFVKRVGVGSALVRHMVRLHPGLPMWTKSDPRAHAFCKALGMRPDEPSSYGRMVFRWTADEAAAFESAPSVRQ